MALLPNKHSGLISSCYLHRFARYALPCSCCLLCGLQARPVQQIKQHNSSVQAPPELVTAHRVARDGHPRCSADLHSPICLNQDKRLGPTRPSRGCRRAPTTVGGLSGRPGAAPAGEGDTEGQHGAEGVMSVPDLRLNSREAVLLHPVQSLSFGAMFTRGHLSLWPKLRAGWQMEWLEGGLVFGLAAGIAGCFLQPRGGTPSLGTELVP